MVMIAISWTLGTPPSPEYDKPEGSTSGIPALGDAMGHALVLVGYERSPVHRWIVHDPGGAATLHHWPGDVRVGQQSRTDL
jgi:hypothetical protein